jgi:hypothetical protein
MTLVFEKKFNSFLSIFAKKFAVTEHTQNKFFVAIDLNFFKCSLWPILHGFSKFQ